MKRTTNVQNKTIIEKRMKSACRAFLLSALIACGLNTAEAYAVPKRYNGPGSGDDTPAAIAVDGSGNVYVTGSAWRGIVGGINRGYDYVTVKYSPKGDLLWEKFYDGSGHGADAAVAIAVDGSGNVYVTGTAWMGIVGGINHGYDYVTIKYSTNPIDGSAIQHWAIPYNGPARGDDRVKGLALDASGNVYITGTSDGSYGLDIATMKYSSSGVELWPAGGVRLDGSEVDEAAALAVTGAGEVFVTGNSVRGITGVDWVIVKYTAAGGYVWHEYLDGGHNGVDVPVALKIHGNHVVVTGRRTNQQGSRGFMTAKYNTDLVPLWVSYWPTGDGLDGQATALAINSLGNVYVTGHYSAGEFNSDYLTTNFGQVWVYDASFQRVPGLVDVVTAIAIDRNNGVYITGFSASVNGQGFDYLTMKLRNGQPPYEWTPTGRRFTSAGNADDIPVAIAVDGNGNVYVTGRSPAQGQGLDIVTVKYSSNGDILW